MKLRSCLSVAVAALLLAAHPLMRGQSIVPSAGTSAYAAVNAFPNLTFCDPTFMLPYPGTNQLLVCGREGQIWTFVNSPSTTTKTLFLDLSAHCQGWSDSGILGFAFHPDFGKAGSPNRGYVYVWYCYTPGPLVGSAAAPPNYMTPIYDRLSRFTVPDGSNVADPSSEYVMINQFDRDLWHNGGAMFFGQDGYLYVTNGDEGGVNNQYGMSQQINTALFGGIFRIDVNENPATSHPIRCQPKPDPGATVPAGWPATYTQGYYIPNDNPFQDPSGHTLEEFWALGLRSPHRMTQDPATGTIWLADVGQNLWEEVDLGQKGANYQWAFKEGFAAGPDAQPATLIGNSTPPIYAYGHYNASGCVIGGYVYRGTKFANALAGLYIFGDYNGNYVWTMSYSGSGTPVVNYLCSLPLRVGDIGGLSSFAQDANGEIYMLTMGPNASIYTLAAPGSQGHLVNLSAQAVAGVGNQPLTAGFYLGGSGTKQILVRADGPVLQTFGVPNCLTDTSLTLDQTSGTVLQQDCHWCTDGQMATLSSAAAAVGAFALPANSNDSALIATAGSGGFVAQVSPNTSAPGTGMVELYDLAPSAPLSAGPQMVNLSCLATVSSQNILIGGFSVGGNAPMRLLIRADGPALQAYNITNYLHEPILTLYDSNGDVLTSNQGWSALMPQPIAEEAQAVGAFALATGSNDSALLVTLAPGTYTAQVTSGDGTSGTALLELYAAP